MKRVMIFTPNYTKTDGGERGIHDCGNGATIKGRLEHGELWVYERHAPHDYRLVIEADGAVTINGVHFSGFEVVPWTPS